MSKRSRLLAVAASAALTATALTAIVAGPSAARMVGSTGASGATVTRSVHGRVYLSITHTGNGLDYVAGHVYDSVLHTGAVTYKSKLVAQPSGTVEIVATAVTLYMPRGSLVGTGTATVTISNGQEVITNGRLKLTKGFGSLKNDTLTARFSGTGSLQANTAMLTYKGTLTESTG